MSCRSWYFQFVMLTLCVPSAFSMHVGTKRKKLNENIKKSKRLKRTVPSLTVLSSHQYVSDLYAECKKKHSINEVIALLNQPYHGPLTPHIFKIIEKLLYDRQSKWSMVFRRMPEKVNVRFHLPKLVEFILNISGSYCSWSEKFDLIHKIIIMNEALSMDEKKDLLKEFILSNEEISDNNKIKVLYMFGSHYACTNKVFCELLSSLHQYISDTRLLKYIYGLSQFLDVLETSSENMRDKIKNKVHYFYNYKDQTIPVSILLSLFTSDGIQFKDGNICSFESITTHEQILYSYALKMLFHSKAFSADEKLKVVKKVVSIIKDGKLKKNLLVLSQFFKRVLLNNQLYFDVNSEIDGIDYNNRPWCAPILFFAIEEPEWKCLTTLFAHNGAKLNVVSNLYDYGLGNNVPFSLLAYSLRSSTGTNMCYVKNQEKYFHLLSLGVPRDIYSLASACFLNYDEISFINVIKDLFEHKVHKKDLRVFQTIFHELCCKDKKLDVVKLFLKYGAQINYKNDKSETSLFSWVLNGPERYLFTSKAWVDLGKILLESGGDPFLKNNEGISVYDFLVDHKNDPEAFLEEEDSINFLPLQYRFEQDLKNLKALCKKVKVKKHIR